MVGINKPIARKSFRVDVLYGDTLHYQQWLVPMDKAWWFKTGYPIPCTEIQVRHGERRIRTIRIEPEWKFCGIGSLSGEPGQSAIYRWGASLRSEQLFPTWLNF